MANFEYSEQYADMRFRILLQNNGLWSVFIDTENKDPFVEGDWIGGLVQSNRTGDQKQMIVEARNLLFKILGFTFPENN